MSYPLVCSPRTNPCLHCQKRPEFLTTFYGKNQSKCAVALCCTFCKDKVNTHHADYLETAKQSALKEWNALHQQAREI